jgi:hypothetical protein
MSADATGDDNGDGDGNVSDRRWRVRCPDCDYSRPTQHYHVAMRMANLGCPNAACTGRGLGVSEVTRPQYPMEVIKTAFGDDEHVVADGGDERVDECAGDDGGDDDGESSDDSSDGGGDYDRDEGGRFV